MTVRAMISKFLCSGCVYGSSVVSCDKASVGVSVLDNCGWCAEHLSRGWAVKEFPPGFCLHTNNMDNLDIHCLDGMPVGFYDSFHVPVWYTEKDGYTFVRGLAPRIANSFTQVLRGCLGDKLKEDWPGIINAGELKVD